jgi:small subunit ribosomal protein S8
MMTDPIADMLTRIRNSNAVHQKRLSMPASRLKVGVAQVLKEEGYIKGYEVTPGEPASSLAIQLKYGPDDELVIRDIQRVSKPGCRVYSGPKDLPPVLGGLGIFILSTPDGVISDRSARAKNVGGEVLCKVS